MKISYYLKIIYVIWRFI